MMKWCFYFPYATQVFASFLDYFEGGPSSSVIICLLLFVLPPFISFSHCQYYCPDFVRVTPHSFSLCAGRSFHSAMSKPLIFDAVEDHS